MIKESAIITLEITHNGEGEVSINQRANAEGVSSEFFAATVAAFLESNAKMLQPTIDSAVSIGKMHSLIKEKDSALQEAYRQMKETQDWMTELQAAQTSLTVELENLKPKRGRKKPASEDPGEPKAGGETKH